MEKFKTRKAVAAGMFYPASHSLLKRQIEAFVTAAPPKTDALACMLPHAGYIYSGRVATETVERIQIRDTVLLLGPNHTGYGANFSLIKQGSWETPFGQVQVNEELASALLEHCRSLEEDYAAQASEHSLEVILPILQYFRTDFQIVPVTFLSDDLVMLKDIGRGIAKAINKQALNKKVLIIASTDMTHYEPKGQAQLKDKEAIQAVLSLSGDNLMQKVRSLNISMCGYAPVIAMLSAAKELGASQAELIKYETSAEATGDAESVVGYAGIIIS